MSDRAGQDNRVLRGDTGVLLRVENGTVIGYDDTGLILRLSDTTLADLRARLGTPETGTTARIDPGVLGDIDAWNVQRDGGWYHFDALLPGYDHPRQFRRRVAGGDILADSAGPLLAIFSLGGARRARGVALRSSHPCHVVAPGDDLGAVGAAGEPAAAGGELQQLSESTLDSLTADALLAARLTERRSLPLIVVRSEHDASGSASALAEGPALANLERAMRNLVAAAAALGTGARIAAVCLDFAAEDVVDDAATHVSALRRIMDRIAAVAGELGLRAPPFVLRADETGARVREHWQLSVFPGAHRVVISAPGYMFDFDHDHRPTLASMTRMAAMEAQAIAADMVRAPWSCPRLLLAERDAPGRVRLTCAAMGPLVLDPATLDAKADCGFSLWAAGQSVAVTGLAICDDDPQVLWIGHDPAYMVDTLHFAVGRRGGLRDDWVGPGTPPLHRWALPAILPVHSC